MWDYYEYADDLVARKKRGAPSGISFEVWDGSRWKPSFDFVRFSFTAVKIADVQSFVKQHPSLSHAFDESMESRLQKVAR